MTPTLERPQPMNDKGRAIVPGLRHVRISDPSCRFDYTPARMIGKMYKARLH